MTNPEKNDTTSSPDSPWLKEGLFDDIEQISTETPAQFPTESPDRTCNLYLKEIQRAGHMSNLENYVTEALSHNPKSYNSINEFTIDNPNYNQDIDAIISEDEKAAILEYSGYRYAWINSVMRGFWDYEKMGKRTAGSEAEIIDTAKTIESAITKSPTPNEDYVTYRGTNLDGFHSYGIKTLSDLDQMEGQFMLERGFVSTSLSPKNSFIEKDFEDNPMRSKADIEVRYKIPSGSHDSIALLTEDLSYSPQQTEVLINRNSLFYISKVAHGENGHYILDAILIPHKVWEPGLRTE